MCWVLYAPMILLCIDDNKTPSMENIYYSVLKTERMLPIWLEDAEDWSKHLLTDGSNCFGRY